MGGQQAVGWMTEIGWGPDEGVESSDREEYTYLIRDREVVGCEDLAEHKQPEELGECADNSNVWSSIAAAVSRDLAGGRDRVAHSKLLACRNPVESHEIVMIEEPWRRHRACGIQTLQRYRKLVLYTVWGPTGNGGYTTGRGIQSMGGKTEALEH